MTGVTPDTIHYAVYDPVLDTIYYNLFWVVERLDGSNCGEAGDLMCDTPPDYLSFLWTCNEDAESPYVQEDPAGQSFRTDGTNYMTYSDDACVNSFSQQQVMMMRDVAQGPRDYLLYNQVIPQTPLENSIHFLWPENNTSVAAEDSVTLQWTPTEGSQFYALEFGRKVSNNFYVPIAKNVVTTSTDYAVPVQPGFNYYWILTAFNRYDLCETVIDTSFFGVSPLTSAKEITMKTLSIYPNPTTDQIHWDIPEDNGTSQYITIHNLQGQSILTWEELTDRTLEINELSPGLYFLNIKTAKDSYGSKLLISSH